MFFFFLMIRRPPRSTLFPYHDALPICYDIPVNDYCNLHYLELVKILWLKLYHLCTNEKEANELKSVDGTEYIFRNNHQKLDELKKLHSEVWNIYQEIEK